MTEQLTVSRKAKVEEVAEIKEVFGKASSFVLVNFSGVNVPMITDLRARFRKAGVEYRVIKNKLIVQALKGTPLEGNASLAKSLKGETGVAFSFEDPTAAAKVVKAFRKENEKHEKLEVKCGVLEATIIPGNRVESDLAGMPGKDEIRAMLLATFLAPMQSLVAQLQAPAQNLVYAFDARERQLNGDETA